MTTAHLPAIEELTPEQSWDLLAGTTVGRLAIRQGSGVDLFPINYLTHDHKLYFRSGPGTKLIELTQEPDVAFEADGRDGHHQWSVVIRGIATRLDTDSEIIDSGVKALKSWYPDGKFNYVRIDAASIVGRRFLPHFLGD